MDVLKIEAEGMTTSFRYPHFMQGVQPSFEMPPPATIYGHICSALGEWVDPTGLLFAYHFTYAARFNDVEHVQLLSASSGKLPCTNLVKALEGNVNPYKRSILFQPKLVLYLNKPEWLRAFRSPCYPVILGRSQDLFTYRRVGVISLESATAAYLEHTLAPYYFAQKTGRGYVELMPRWLDYNNRRAPIFARYVVLNRRVFPSDLLQHEGQQESGYIVDPEFPEVNGFKLGLLFHSFTGDKDDTFNASMVG